MYVPLFILSRPAQTIFVADQGPHFDTFQRGGLGQQQTSFELGELKVSMYVSMVSGKVRTSK